jgi:hypothetical protein
MESRARSPFVVGLIAVLAFALILVFALPFVTALVLKPMARDKVVELLEKRFDKVELERLDIGFAPALSFVPRISATGTGLSVSLEGREDAPPFIAMSEFECEVSLLGLMRDPIRIENLRLAQLEIQIPPKQPGDADSESKKDGEPPPVFVIEELVADGAMLRIHPKNPEKDPLQFDLHELRVLSAGVTEPMRFDALLDNAKPPGKIDTKGEFGPLSISDPGASPVSGDYVFEKADLSVFGGIGGILRSEGRFDGILERIDVSGFTEMPGFQLKSVGNPVHLRTEFEAVVDGTNGNTLLVPVNAILEGSHFSTEGGVAHVPGGPKGKTVCVDAEGSDVRIEDFLLLAMKSARPFMTGDLRFKSMIRIPPGDVDVVDKLILDGEFAIKSALFPESKVQEKVDKLSEVGTPEEGEADPLAPLREERVFSDMRGEFKLSDGVLNLSHLSFTVPGAAVTMEGTYGLKNQSIDFRGELRLNAKLSETTSGLKSFLLKLVDPLFKTDDAGAVIPIKVSGTADKPSFGVEVGRVLSGKEVSSPPRAPTSWNWRRGNPPRPRERPAPADPPRPRPLHPPSRPGGVSFRHGTGNDRIRQDGRGHDGAHDRRGPPGGGFRSRSQRARLGSKRGGSSRRDARGSGGPPPLAPDRLDDGARGESRGRRDPGARGTAPSGRHRRRRRKQPLSRYPSPCLGARGEDDSSRGHRHERRNLGARAGLQPDGGRLRRGGRASPAHLPIARSRSR